MPADKTNTTDHLIELSRIIANSVEDLQRACDKGNFKFPSLDDAYTPESDAFHTSPDVSEAVELIAAAAYQLVSTVLPASKALFGLHVSGVNKTACLRVCTEANVAEILREAGPEGLNVDEIAARSGVPSHKIGRILRYLATYHVFKEVKPDVFTNTRLSSVVDTGKSITEIKVNPAAKHENTSGFPALVCHHLDEVQKGSAYLWEVLADPLTADSREATKTACNLAFNTDLPMWQFLEGPDQAHRSKRFGHAMAGVRTLYPKDDIINAYDWKSLPSDTVVVDVGGGVGTSSLRLAQNYPHLRLVNQDRQSVIEAATKIWNATLPEALESGRAQLQGHDFFAEQPVKHASVFLLKHVIYDWSDQYAIKILQRLREVAQPHTKLILVENPVRLACPFPTTEEENNIPGAIPREAKPPLLANYGINNAVGYFTDLAMMVGFNAQERTVTQYSALMKQTGWKLVQVGRTEGAVQQSLQAVPV